MTRRTEQLESTLRKVIGQLLEEGVNDPRVRGMISVLDVKMSDDMRKAIVEVSIYPEEQTRLTLSGLRSATLHIQKRASGLIRTRKMPHLEFKLSDTIKKQAEILTAIRDAVALENKSESADSESEVNLANEEDNLS